MPRVLPPVNAKNVQSYVQMNKARTNMTALSEFCRHYHVEGCKIDKVVGQNSQLPSGESNLDSQQLLSTNPGTVTWLYSLDNDEECSVFLKLASALLADEHAFTLSISYLTTLSWVCPNDLERKFNEEMQKAGLLGVTFIAASDDSGSQVDGSRLTTSFPSRCPNVLAVGAGRLVNAAHTEFAATNYFGSGGGASWLFDAEPYQKPYIAGYIEESREAGKLPNAKYAYAKGGRAIPDVCGFGQDVAFLYGGQLSGQGGGTSASAPQWAGVVGMLNNKRLNAGMKTMGYINPFIYAVPAACFTDITKGNDFPPTSYVRNPTGWWALKGYDMVTGRGLPNVTCLLEHAVKPPSAWASTRAE